MHDPMDPFIGGYSRAEGEYQYGDGESPKIKFFPVAERMCVVCWQRGAPQTVEQEDLIAGIHERVNGLAQHG